MLFRPGSIRTRRAGMALALAGLLLRAQAVTLDACIEAALAGNPDVRAAAERAQAARAAIREAYSAYYPTLGASAGYALTDNPPQAFMMLLNQRDVSMQSDFNNPPSTDNLALSLGAQYMLFDFGRRGLDARMARDSAEIARLVLRGLQNDLVHQVTAGYHGVLQAAAYVTAQEESVQTLMESRRVAQERLQAGGALQTDVLNLDVQLSRANDDLIRARNGVKLAIAALNTAIGHEMASATNMPAALTGPGARPRETDDPAVIQSRPEMQAALLMSEIRESGYTKARRQYTPTLSVFGTLDWNSDVSTDFENSYMVGAQAQVAIFDGFRRRAAVTAAAAQARAARSDIDKVANQLRLDLTTALIKAGEAWERMETAKKCTESAEEALRITRERYQSGAADIPELLTAQTGLTGTRTRNISALYDYLTALSNLDRARGVLVQRHVNTPNKE